MTNSITNPMKKIIFTTATVAALFCSIALIQSNPASAEEGPSMDTQISGDQAAAAIDKVSQPEIQDAVSMRMKFMNQRIDERMKNGEISADEAAELRAYIQANQDVVKNPHFKDMLKEQAKKAKSIGKTMGTWVLEGPAYAAGAVSMSAMTPFVATGSFAKHLFVGDKMPKKRSAANGVEGGAAVAGIFGEVGGLDVLGDIFGIGASAGIPVGGAVALVTQLVCEKKVEKAELLHFCGNWHKMNRKIFLSAAHLGARGGNAVHNFFTGKHTGQDAVAVKSAQSVQSAKFLVTPVNPERTQEIAVDATAADAPVAAQAAEVSAASSADANDIHVDRWSKLASQPDLSLNY